MMALIEERGRGRGGEHTGIVIHSLLSPVSVCRTFPLHHCHLVHSVFSLFFFSYPHKNYTCHSAFVRPFLLHTCIYSLWEQHKTSASFENANGFYLWPAAVTEWAIVLREVFVCSCVCKCVCKNWAPLVKISLCECAND